MAGVAGAIGGALIQGKAAGDAADAQRSAAIADRQLQTETRDLIRGDLQPYRQGGNNAYSAYMYELGLGPRPTFGGTGPMIESFTPGQGWSSAGGIAANMGPGSGGAPGIQQGGQGFTVADIINGMALGGGISKPAGGGAAGPMGSPTQFRVGGRTFNTMQEAQAFANANQTGGQQYGGFQKSQDYLFGLNEGTNAIQASAAARGGLFSGATMRDLNIFGQDYGSQRRGEYLNRLAGVADTGMNAAQMSGNASMAAAGNISNALAAQGNAAAAGAIGRGNAWSDGIGNALGAWNYMRPQGGAAQGGGSPRPMGNPFY